LIRAALIAGLLLLGCRESSPPLDETKARADGMYLDALTTFHGGDAKAARTKLEAVRALNPADPRLPATLGEVLLTLGDLPAALAEFEKAVAADSKRSTTWTKIGFIRSLQGNRAGAVAALDRAIALNPRDSQALELRGDLHLKEGELDAAVRRWVEAARLSRDLDQAFIYLRASNELARRGRAEYALELLQEAADAGVREPELMSELADRLVERGELEAALAAYRAGAESSAKRKQPDPTLWEVVGELELRLGRTAEAEAAFHRSLAQKERAVVRVALARLARGRNDQRALQEHLDKALAAATGEEKRELVELAALLSELRRPREAMMLLQQLVEEPEGKGDPELLLRLARAAKEAKDPLILRAACAQALDAGVSRCP
jgi:tetratricopeptide (TPR) repeat protein